MKSHQSDHYIEVFLFVSSCFAVSDHVVNVFDIDSSRDTDRGLEESDVFSFSDIVKPLFVEVDFASDDSIV